MSGPLFGPAGLSASYHEKYKNAKNASEYTASFGLTAFEYQFGHGVRIPRETAALLKKTGGEYGVRYSVHAPYYISMASPDDEKRLNSLRYIKQSAEAVKSLGGNRVVFHTGSCGKQARGAAMSKAMDTLGQMLEALDEAGHGDVYICPETMGKLNQLGTVDEVLEMCKKDKRIIPCVDFGHLYARSHGEMKGREHFALVLDAMEDALQDDRAKRFHVHFSRIAYTAGGEKHHLTFEDKDWGPGYQPLLELCYERGLEPVIICESAGSQAEDARTMAKYYEKISKQAGR